MRPAPEPETPNSPRGGLSALIKKRWVSTLISLAMIALSTLILGWLLYSQREVLAGYHWRLRWGFLAGAFLLHGATLLMGALVWASIINTIGPKLAFRHQFKLFCINMLARRIPGTVWYMVYRAQAYSRYGINAATTTLASGIEMGIGIISGILATLIFAVSILLQWGVNAWVLVAVLAGLVLLLNPRLLRWAVRRSSRQEVSLSYTHLVAWTALYVLLWLLGGVILFMVVSMFTPVPLAQLSFVIGSWSLVGTSSYMLLLLPSNFGFSEASISLLLAQIIPSSLAVLAAIAMRVVLILSEIIWTVGSLLFLKSKD